MVTKISSKTWPNVNDLVQVSPLKFRFKSRDRYVISTFSSALDPRTSPNVDLQGQSDGE